MKRIRLIEPRRRIESLYTYYLRRWPLMGPVILATILHQKGYDARAYSENISGSLLDSPWALTDIAQADYVGISIMTPTASRGYLLADAIRKLNPNAKIIFGGVHATVCPEEALRHCDIVVRGEGENVIEAIVRGEAGEGILNGTPVDNLDSLPLPKYELIYEHHKLWELDGGKEFYRAPLVTSRGCPYNCKYCSVTRMFGHRFRFRSAERVIEDIRKLYEDGYRGFFFYDDNFTADHERVKIILERVRELDVRWNAQVRLDFAWVDPKHRRQCDTELLDTMRESGGDVLYIGYETIDDETAKEWRKGYTGEGSLRHRSAQDTQTVHSAGFWIHGMFVAGPRHGESTFQEIVRFSRENDIETIQISALTPFPGTALFDSAKGNLIFTRYPGDWDVYDGLHSVYHHTQMGIRKFQEKLIQAHRQFYRASWLHTGRIAKLFKGHGSLAHKAKYFAKWARLSSGILRGWDRETREFLKEVSARDRRALLPA